MKKAKTDKQKKIEQAVSQILEAIGEDINREGIRKTPERVARMLDELLNGYGSHLQEYLKVFHETEKYEEMVLVRDIPFYSICEHHLLPFFGKIHIAYIPRNGNVVGVSKLGRLADGFAHRLQMQERLTKQIADSIMKALKPLGVLVIVEAEHLCMTIRGVKKPGSRITTSAMRGIFLSDARTRSEALTLIGHR